MDKQYSPQIQYLIDVILELKPFERVEIIKDQTGKPNNYLVHRSQKIVVTDFKIENKKVI